PGRQRTGSRNCTDDARNATGTHVHVMTPHSHSRSANVVKVRSNTMKPVQIGVGGPVGAGKTQLIERITRALADEFSMAAITNDIYTIEDAKILASNGVLPLDRIIGIETGG